jgi:hypothetical protein
MKKIVALCGGSGVGKTYTRTTDPALKDLPALDIADCYKDYPFATPSEALSVFVSRLVEWIEDGIENIVVEAYFREGSSQRNWLNYVAEANGYTVEYITLLGDFETRKERILKQFVEGETHTRTEARMKLLHLEFNLPYRSGTWASMERQTL